MRGPLLVLAVASSACQIDLSESAAGFLGASRFRKLHIEIDHDEGAAPPPGSVRHLEAMVSQIMDKPGGVTIDLEALPPRPYPPFGKYTVDEQLELMDAHRGSFDEGDTASLYVLFLFGYDDEYRMAGGRVVAPGSIVMYAEMVHELCDFTFSNMVSFASGDAVECGTSKAPRPAVVMPQLWNGPHSLGCERVTTNTWMHELGHVLGLVDLGTQMIRDHKAEESAVHCGEPDCLMMQRDDLRIGPCEDEYTLRDFGPECARDLSALRWSLTTAR